MKGVISLSGFSTEGQSGLYVVIAKPLVKSEDFSTASTLLVASLDQVQNSSLSSIELTPCRNLLFKMVSAWTFPTNQFRFWFEVEIVAVGKK